MTPTLDPRMPPLDRVVLRDMLDRHARERADKQFARFADGSTWTYRQARDIAARTAHALRALGVRQGDHVVSWLPNGPDALRVWFGLNVLGAVYVPINLSYRGKLLEHVIRTAGARLLIAHADLVARLADISHGDLTDVVALGVAVTAVAAAAPLAGLVLHDQSVLDQGGSDGADTSPPPLERAIAPWDTQTIIYTSGTTGPSKGVLSSYLHIHSMAAALQDMSEHDRFMINLPMFHVGGTMPITRMLIEGGSFVMVDAFDTESFWPTVRANGITSVILLGVMLGFLLKRPVLANERAHTLRCATIVPFNATALEFSERFGVTAYTHFNMTEISMPIRSGPNPRSLGSCGRPRPGVQVRIVDDNDCEVPVGTVGELIVRSDCPWAMNHGYANNPEATAQAWRNGWFHTGDALKVDADGDYYYVDRIKDALRRRGENISSFEIESEVLAHPKVREAAVIAAPSELSEDEVMVVVALVEGETLDPAELIHFLIPRMAHFMVPRFVRIVDALPRTPTQKIQKHVLRAAGMGADVWDRDKAGIVVKREKIGTLTRP